MSEFELVEICGKAPAHESIMQQPNGASADCSVAIVAEVQSDANKTQKHVAAHCRMLPKWVKPHMIYPQDSIKSKCFLGSGQYGTVHKGTFQQGHAV